MLFDVVQNTYVVVIHCVICLTSYCGAYTMDVIASTGFGLQIDSHNDPNNPFVRYSKEIFSFNVRSRKAILLSKYRFLCVDDMPRDEL
jgi:hypothetical protein